uniref:Uncharacterized protein n=1 Tax=Anguilla anguilla TaxID=7936 RepID=A0A0E9UJ49_ANGAN
MVISGDIQNFDSPSLPFLLFVSSSKREGECENSTSKSACRQKSTDFHSMYLSNVGVTTSRH